jgi:hypothetical protein
MSKLAAALLLCVASSIAIFQVGCATYTAVRIPGPVPDERVALGAHRSDVEVLLKAPPANEYKEGDGTIARYQYKDGPHQASKGRVVLYIAGDVFTLFLSELIFWPIEAYASKQTERIATAHYDGANQLESWAVDRPGGERLISLGDPAPPAVASKPAQSDTSPHKAGYSKTAR